MKEKIKKVIGMQIFTNEIRAVQLTGTPDAIRVSNYGSMPLPDGTVVEGVIIKPEVFMQAFQNVMTTGKFSAKSIIVEVSNESVIMRLATFPKVPEDKQRNVIMLQAQNFIPIPLNELELNFLIVDETVPESEPEPAPADGSSTDAPANLDNEPQVDVLLVGAKREMLTKIVDTLQLERYGGYQVEDINLGVTAIADEIAVQTDAKTYLVMHVNNDVVNILVINEDKIILARSVQVNSELSERLNKNANKPVPDEDLNEILEIIKSEYWSSANYYKVANYYEIEKLYIYTQLEALAQRVSEISVDIGVKVERVSMNRKIKAENAFPIDKFIGCICVAADRLG